MLAAVYGYAGLNRPALCLLDSFPRSCVVTFAQPLFLLDINFHATVGGQTLNQLGTTTLTLHHRLRLASATCL